jgi:type I restriction enzyme S subunit
MRNEGWRTASLGDKDIALTASGGTPDRSDASNFGGDIAWVKSGELNDNIIYATEEKLTERGFQNSSAKLFPRGTLLLAMYGATAGKTAILGIEAATNQAVCAIFPQKGSFDSRFLQFRLMYDRPILLSARSGGAQPNISQRVIATLVVVLPPMEEQRAIARALETVQMATEARHREFALECERKAALMEYLFTHGTRGEPIKKTEIGEIPESWQLTTLGELCEDDLGLIQTGPFGSQLHASDYVQSGIPVVNPTHLLINGIETDRLPHISEKLAHSLSRHYLQEGDILISRRGDFSRFAFIGQEQAGWLCGTGCLLVRLANPNVDNYFFAASMSLKPTQNYLRQAAVGSIMPNLNTRILSQMPVALPGIEEQRRIAEVVRACEAKIGALEREAPLFDELFRAMLEELITGQLSAVPLIEEHQPK